MHAFGNLCAKYVNSVYNFAPEPEHVRVHVVLSVNVPVPLVCLAEPLQMSEVMGSEAGTGPSFAQGSTGPPEEDVLGGNGGPQGSALGGVTATGEGRTRKGGEG